MAKRKNTLFNMTSTLFIIAGVAAFTLAQVNEVTKGPISKTEQKKIEEAINEVIPEFEELIINKIKCFDSEDSLAVYYGINNNDTIGIAVESYTMQGYSGLIRIMVGFLPDGTIHQTKVLKHAETPGLGTKMEDDKFKNQFAGQHPNEFNLSVRKDGGDIDAITASTITSRAYCDGINRAYKSIWEGGKE